LCEIREVGRPRFINPPDVRLVIVVAAVMPLAATIVRAAGGPPSEGTPITATARVEQLAVVDPGTRGSWGLIRYRTTTGLFCLQAGRLVRGRVGVIDRAHHLRVRLGYGLCTDARPADPVRNIGASMGQAWPTGQVKGCIPGEASCRPGTTRTVAVIATGPALAHVWVAHGHRWQASPFSARDGAVVLVLAPSKHVAVRLDFRGGCSKSKRRALMGFYRARRRGCLVRIPISLGTP
jgi:hypothetical protein